MLFWKMPPMSLEAVKDVEGEDRQHQTLQLCYHLPAKIFHSIVPFVNLAMAAN